MIIFSIVIPCYNSEKTIVTALSSVINQTFKNFEIIIVDDGSIDNTKRVINQFLKKYNIKYKYIYQTNLGPSIARNVGVMNAEGKYIAFLDSDDEWHIKKLEIQYKVIKKYNAKFISSNYTLKEFKEKIYEDFDIKLYNFNDFLFSNKTSTPCVIVEKRLFKDIGGFLGNLKYSEDYNLWLRILRKEKLYKITNPPLVKLHKKPYGEKGLSSNLWKMESGELYNYNYCLKNNYINKPKYLFLIFFSFVKFLKRLIYIKIKKILFY